MLIPSSSKGPSSIMISPMIMGITITLIRISSSRYHHSPLDIACQSCISDTPSFSMAEVGPSNWGIMSIYVFLWGSLLLCQVSCEDKQLQEVGICVSLLLLFEVIYSCFFSLSSYFYSRCVSFSIN